jgi:hypothetical protein
MSMPLTATLDGQRFDALFATDRDWQDLKRTYRSRALAMGCGQPGVPRKSKLGLRHLSTRPPWVAQTWRALLSPCST